ncbi:Uncharacterised protein [Vibrio cholerae]|nr:Uncharacterised protein [Vibrio cholerae]
MWYYKRAFFFPEVWRTIFVYVNRRPAMKKSVMPLN